MNSVPVINQTAFVPGCRGSEGVLKRNGKVACPLLSGESAGVCILYVCQAAQRRARREAASIPLFVEVNQLPVYVQVILRHAFRGKALLELLPASMSIYQGNQFDRFDHIAHATTQEPRDTILNDLRKRSTIVGNDRCAAGQRLDQGQAERFRSIVGTDQCLGVAEKLALSRRR